MQTEQSPVSSGCWPEIPTEKPYQLPPRPATPLEKYKLASNPRANQPPIATILRITLWAPSISLCSSPFLPPPLCVVGFLSLQNHCETELDAFWRPLLTLKDGRCCIRELSLWPVKLLLPSPYAPVTCLCISPSSSSDCSLTSKPDLGAQPSARKSS